MYLPDQATPSAKVKHFCKYLYERDVNARRSNSITEHGQDVGVFFSITIDA